uniref:Ig-like domain-containing protein n=1 Tax=Latimeria chalumnae TaxID=7897 RepID=H3B0F7_LATCH
HFVCCGEVCVVISSKFRSDEFPPRIIDQPVDLIVPRERPATLNCRAEGNPEPAIQWFRNGEYVETNKDDIYSQRTLLPDGSLFFLRLNQRKGKSDEGVYTCVARNHLGTAISRNASLYIRALQEEFRRHPSDVVVTVGEQVVLECSPPRGHPEPVVTWKKDGTLMHRKDQSYVMHNGKLTIAHAQKTDSGVYVCIATNEAGQRESRAAQISVLEKPVFTRRPSDAAVKSGSTVLFSCETRGDPIPAVHWYKEEGQLPAGRQDVEDENQIFLKKILNG